MVKGLLEKIAAAEWTFTKILMPIFGIFFTVAITLIGFTIKAQLITNKEISITNTHMKDTLNIMAINQAVGNNTLINIKESLQALQEKQSATDARVGTLEIKVEKINGNVEVLKDSFREAKNGY